MPVIPAPTRTLCTLYTSTKAASLKLSQWNILVELPLLFACLPPCRATSVLVDATRHVKEREPNTKGLKREYVAQRYIQAIDDGENLKTVFIPIFMHFSHIFYWIWLSLVESEAKKKYNSLSKIFVVHSSCITNHYANKKFECNFE